MAKDPAVLRDRLLRDYFSCWSKGYIYREVLKGSYYIKVLRVFWATPNCPGNISIGGIEKARKYFIYIY